MMGKKRLANLLWGLAIVLAAGCQRRPPDSAARLAALLPASDSAAVRSDRPAADAWLRAAGPRTFRFPEDHGAHEDYRIEWWYYTGNVQTPTGRRFGYQLTFFRTGLQMRPGNPSRWAVRDLYTAHWAISDIQREQHHHWQRNRRAGIDQAGAETGRLCVWNGGWRAEMSGDTHRLLAGSGDFSLRLELTPRKPLVLHGDEGLSQKGHSEGNASYYYSFPRLDTSGVITVAGVEYPVHGSSWMDHEFSTSLLEEGQLGWDWFSIQFDDNTELMLYQMRLDDGTVDPYSLGTYVAENGESTRLAAEDFRMQPITTWRSTRTSADYPVRWQIEIPKLDMKLQVDAAFNAQEMDTRATTGISYWEGSVSVRGTRDRAEIGGTGYLEMTGYLGKGLGSVLKTPED
jgi:predicted secreted hydrolase